MIAVEVSLDVCRTLAVRHGLPLQFVVKEFFVFDVLGRIASLPAPGEKIVFKGGTALNKVYLGGLQRFSEDLDFDSGTTSLAETRAACGRLARGISGYDTTEFRRVKDTVQFHCVFNSPLGGRDHVRVDVAAKKIACARPLVAGRAASEFAQSVVAGFAVYSLEDLVARKLHALATRAEGKDFYDVYNALSLCGELRKPIEKMLESEESSEDAEGFVWKAISVVKKADAKKLRNLTNPFIPKNLRPPDWLELKNDLALKLERLLE